MIRSVALLISLVALSQACAPARADVAEVVQAAGVRGGLVVHVGCGDGRQTASLLVNDRFCVHGLDTDAARVQAARQHLQSIGLYGPVSASVFDGRRLPYVDSLVNLLIADPLGDIPQDELMRVLAPGGVAMVDGEKIVKPWPGDIDGWSHHLHGADNNAVARDSRVSTPRQFQWTCGPLWSRSHEFISSVSGMISDGGRLFYFFDEGLTGTTDPPVPERWKLIARDAFNGKLLWKREIEEWGTRGWRKPALRGTSPLAPHRFVAGDGHLFATLGFTAPVSMLDAATGEERITYDDTEGAQELRYRDGVLVVRQDDGLQALDAASGARLWQVDGRIRPQTTAVAAGKVFYQDGLTLCCRGLKDGQEIWQATEKTAVKQLLIGDGRLIVAGSTLKALDAGTGTIHWEISGGPARDPLFAVNGQLWVDQTTGLDLATGQVKTKITGTEAVCSAGHHPRCYPRKATERFMITPFRGAEFISLAGESHAQNDWLRGPCTFGVLPCNGLLYVAPNPCFCYTGVKLTGFNALAGADSRGAAPIPDDQRLQPGPAFGQVVASAAQAADPDDWPTYRHDARRSSGASTEVAVDLRPCWSVELGGRLTQPVVVRSHPGDPARGLVLVAARDAHTLYALDRQDGRTLWTYIADGRIDSPPSVSGGLVLFGSAQGSVHCLRAADGALVWKFRAAATDQLMMADDQLESPWRVHGSVLVVGGVAYFTAGRSTNLDGGIRIYGLDIASGRVLHQTILDTWSPTRTDAEGKPFVPAYHMEGAFSDILVNEGGSIYLGQYQFDLALNQQEAPYVLPDPAKSSLAMGRTELMDAPFVEAMQSMEKDETVQREWQLRNHPELMADLAARYGGASLGDRKMGRHVFATSGFLDDSWYNRTFWMYSETWPGFYIANRAAKTGQLLCVDETQTYAVQAYPLRNLQSPLFKPAEHGYLLFADRNDNEPVLPEYTRNVPKGIGFTRQAPPVWYQWIPVRIRAMVAAKNALFVAGPPDVLDPDDPMAAFDGRRGAVLWAVSKSDGQKLAEYPLPAAPVFDGLSAAAGRLYLSTLDGKVTCLGR